MRQLLLSVFVAAFAFTSVAAHKNTKSFNDCIPSFDNLVAVTTSATSLTGKEEAGLIKIASDAKNLYSIGKIEDAVVKLQNYQLKLDQLAATVSNPNPKINAWDEAALRTALNETIACVSGV